MMKVVHPVILDVNCEQPECPNCPGFLYQIRETDMFNPDDSTVIDESKVFKTRQECLDAAIASRPKYIEAYKRVMSDETKVEQVLQ